MSRGGVLTRYRSRALIAFGIAVYAGVVWYLGWENVARALRSADGAGLFMAAGLLLAGNWLRALKWRYALDAGNEAFGLYFMSKASAEWTPGRLGEFAPLLLRRHRTSRMMAWIALDRVIEIAATLALGLTGAVIVGLLPVGVGIGVVVAGLVAGGFIIALGPSISVREADDVVTNFQRLRRFIVALIAEAKSFRAKLPLAAVLTLAPKVIDLAAVAVLFAAFGYAPGFWLLAAAKCALAAVAFFPLTPLATGLPHLTQASLLHHAAGIPSADLAAAIGVEVAMVSGLLWTSFAVASLLWRPEQAPVSASAA